MTLATQVRGIRAIVSRYRKIRYHLDTLVLPELSLSEYWPIDKQAEFQNQRFLAVFQHHYRNNPAYHRLCQDYGITQKGITGLHDIGRLPIVERRWLKNNRSAILEHYDQGLRMYTGGSTGETLEYRGCARYHLMRERVHERGWSYFGCCSGDEFTVISSAQGRTATSRYLDGELTLANMQRIVTAINSPEIRFVRGYASSIYILATYMNQKNIRNDHVQVFNLISENVYPWEVQAIKSAFPLADVYEEYCCNDGGASAWECSAHAGLHEAVERSFIEVDNDGEVIVTDLWNRAMPFIRYRNGDRLVSRTIETCACGRSLPRIRVQGRTNDIIVTPFGPVSPTYLMYWGAGYDGGGRPGFSQIQYVQNPGYHLSVFLVMNDMYIEQDFDRLSREMTRILRGMQIEFHFVDQIATTSSGKRKFIINNDRELLSQWQETGIGMPKSL